MGAGNDNYVFSGVLTGAVIVTLLALFFGGKSSNQRKNDKENLK